MQAIFTLEYLNKYEESDIFLYNIQETYIPEYFFLIISENED